MFCEGVQHHLQFFLDNRICLKMAAIQFYSQSRKHRKVGWMGSDSRCFFFFFRKNSLVKKEVWDVVLSWCSSQFFYHQSYSICSI
jgi:hypothetical protein